MTQDLFAAVYADPDADEPRKRIAALGGPRGEFITIQLMRAWGEKLPKKDGGVENRLLRDHALQWVEPYGEALVLDTILWERGFPVGGHLNFGGRWRKTKRLLELVPALATLRQLDLGAANTVQDAEIAAQVVLLPALRHLRQLDGLQPNLLAKLATAQPPFALEVIRCAPPGGGPGGERDEARERTALDKALAKGTGLPQLRELTLEWRPGHDQPQDYAWLFKSEVGRRLKVLRFSCTDFEKTLPLWHAALNEAFARIELETLELRYGDWGLLLERTENGFTRLHGDISRSKHSRLKGGLDQALAKLGPDQLPDLDVKGYRRPS